MALAIALLAAGESRRMRGRDKLLEPVNGVAILRHLAIEAIAAGLGPVAVALRLDAPARTGALEELALDALPVPDADEGMSASLRTAARWAQAQGVTGLMVCPADMPELEAQDFMTLAAAFTPDGPILRASASDGTPGHPVLFPARLLPGFATLSGDRGAQPILQDHPPRLIPLPDQRAVIDLDTPEDWHDWRNRRASKA